MRFYIFQLSARWERLKIDFYWSSFYKKYFAPKIDLVNYIPKFKEVCECGHKLINDFEGIFDFCPNCNMPTEIIKRPIVCNYCQFVIFSTAQRKYHTNKTCLEIRGLIRELIKTKVEIMLGKKYFLENSEINVIII